MRRYFFYLILIVLLYYPALKLGFSQDDFFFLRMSAVNSFGDVINFFNPLSQGTFPFFRPLGTQLYFYLFKSPFVMHLFMLLVHALSVTQVFKLFVNLGFDKRKSNLVALVYLFSSIHFLSLVYIAATQHLLATSFSLLSLNAFFAASPVLSVLFFTLALLSKESAIILPAVAGLLYLYKEKSFPKFSILVNKFSPYLLTAIIYILVRIYSGITIQSEYSYAIDSRVFATLRFYGLFLLGFMESIQDYPLVRGLTQYLIDTKIWGYLTLIGGVGSIIFLAFSVLKKQLELKNLLLGSLLFLTGLALYIGLPSHLYPHYLDYSLLGFLLILTGVKHKLLLKLITLALVLAGVGGIYSSFRLHWSVTRARLNDKYIPSLLSQGVCTSSPVIIGGDQITVRNLSYSLSGSNGLSIICKKEMDVYFTGVSEVIPPGNTIEVKSL